MTKNTVYDAAGGIAVSLSCDTTSCVCRHARSVTVCVVGQPHVSLVQSILEKGAALLAKHP